jgi:MYXO-CTERM domain-containing protein
VAGTGLKNALIAHNTLVQAADTGMQIDKGAHASTTLANNIIVQSNGLMINLNSGLAGLTFSHNNWLGGPAGAAASANDIVGNCDLADLASLDPAGFKLGQNAPCKDKGLALPVVKTDFFGTPRPVGAGYDVGAHEAVGTVPAADGGVKDAKPSASDAKPPSADTKLPASDGALPSGDAAKKPDGVGDGAARPDAGGPGNGDGGCGCFVAGAADPSLVGVVLLALALGLARARRRVR